MSLKDDLTAECREMFSRSWGEPEKAAKVPAPEDLRLNQNHAKLLEDAVVLYADLDGSTSMVDQHTWFFAAEMYKAYLRCASTIIKQNDGVITAYDGDRVMAIFFDGPKNTNAVKAALELNYAVEQVIRPQVSAVYTTNTFVLRHVVGIDRSDLHAVRIGVRNDNDITWVGRAANYAAKLCALSEQPLWITKAVYDIMTDIVKYNTESVLGTNMWTARSWTQMGGAPIYCTNFRRSF